MTEIRDEVFCDDGGIWVRDPRGNCRPFDINDYDALRAELDQLRNEMWEAGARAVYDQWSHVEGWVPWVAGGNSLKQCDARRLVRKAFDAGRAALEQGNG